MFARAGVVAATVLAVSCFALPLTAWPGHAQAAEPAKARTARTPVRKAKAVKPAARKVARHTNSKHRPARTAAPLIEPPSAAAQPPAVEPSASTAAVAATAVASTAAAPAPLAAPAALSPEALELLRRFEIPTTTIEAQTVPVASAETGPAPAHPAGLLGATASRINDMLVYALSHIGVRYRFGGNTPESGFDCSGLVRWVYNRSWGLMLPRRANEIAQVGQTVPKDQLEPGDLVFFNTLKRTFSHVGIYLGNGEFVHAPSTGGTVRIDSLDEAYWQKRWNGARRLVAGPADDTPAGSAASAPNAAPIIH